MAETKAEKPAKAEKKVKVGTVISRCLNKGTVATETILKEVQKEFPDVDVPKVRRQIYSRRWAHKKNRKSK